MAESILLKKYEYAIAKKTLFIAVSKTDAAYYRDKFGANASHLPVFIPWNEIKDCSTQGCFCLYHGNLAINENEKAAEWLLNNVFNNLDIPFVIAGKSPSLSLQLLAKNHPNTCITGTPGEKEMDDLISKAHVHILPSFNQTGVKLKLLNALFNGRHCIVNKNGACGSGAETLCHVAETAEEFKSALKKLFEMPYTAADREERKTVLAGYYDNEKNASKLIEWLY